ncbi:MAG: lysophospholipid acyltransferase family protein [Patescibacteria group bacterium]
MKERDGSRPMVHRKGRQPQRAIVEFLASHYAPEIQVNGIENLREPQLGDKGDIFVANHRSHADYTIFDQSLKRNDLEEIAKRTIPLSGLRVEGNPIARLLIPAYNRVLIWSSTVEPRNKREKKKKFRMDRETLTYTKWNLGHGYNTLVFPEGTRSRTGMLGQGQPGIVHIFNLVDNVRIVPVAISGTEKILPPGKLLPKRGCPTVSFLQPIEVYELNDLSKHIKDKRERQMYIINFVMSILVLSLHQEDQRVYAKI